MKGAYWTVHRWVVAYDIPDDRRRLELAALLEAAGGRVQYSVFECLLNQKGLRRLRGKVLRIIDPSVDKVRFYPVCASCAVGIEVQGASGNVDSEDGFVVV